MNIKVFMSELKRLNRGLIALLLSFLFISILVRGNGMTNADSRFATMQAMKDHQTFKINEYKDWTVDWSYRDGNYYSNKAPGPMLLGFPIYLVFKGTYDRLNPIKSKEPPTSSIRSLINLFSQVLPIFIFLLFIVNNLSRGPSEDREGLFIGLVLFLYGTTASLFFNSFFGHGMAAGFSFGLCYFFSKEKYREVGLFFGLALLCDYGASVFLIPLILFIPKRNLFSFIIGGIFPAILWTIYHLPVTGSVFVTPNKFINPIFKEAEQGLLWGAISLPKIKIIWELLFGLKRGILITQPWVLFYLLFSLPRLRENKTIFDSLRRVTFLGFILIFLLNSSFNGWHGGATAGPRYLSVGLAAICFSFIYDWKYFSNYKRLILYISIGYTLLFKALALMTSALVSENEYLLAWMLDFLLNKAGTKQFVRFPIFIGLLGISYYLFNKAKDTYKDPNTSS